MSGWRLAKSLETLRGEIDNAYPDRSKRSDGSIGDAAHQASGSSDHLPNADGVVCAIDITHDPGSGADMDELSEAVRTSGNRSLKYIIWNRRIWSASRASQGWRTYGGRNPHTKHMHVSVGHGSDGHSTGPYDYTGPWGITSNSVEDDVIGLEYGDKGERVKALQYMLREAGHEPGSADGVYGKSTEKAVRKLLKAAGSGIPTGKEIQGATYFHLMMAVMDRKLEAAEIKP